MKKELARAKEKAIKEHKSFEQFSDNLADESLGVFFQGFEDCKKRMKKSFLNINIALLILSLGVSPRKDSNSH